MRHLLVIWIGWSRFVRNRKLQSAASIIGLALGLACFSASMLWLRHIESYEDFAPDSDRIYLMGSKQSDYSGYAKYNSEGYYAKFLIDNFHEVESAARFSRFASARVLDADDKYKAHIDGADLRYVVPEYFDMYGMKPIAGSTNLTEPDQIVLTRSIATRLFGTDRAVGQTIRMRGNNHEHGGQALKVIGVIENWPENSQLGGDVFCTSPASSSDRFGYDHRWCAMFKVKPRTDMKAFESKVLTRVATLSQHVAEFAPHMLPLRKLRSVYPSQALQVNTAFVRLFVLLGLLVIATSLCNFLIALINNLHLRARNMMLHRIAGATTCRIILLNALDTLVLMILSASISILIITLFLPIFRQYAQIEISTASALQHVCLYMLLWIALSIAVSAIATFIVLHANLRESLHMHRSHRSSSGLDRISMVIQLGMSIIMITCTLTMMMQIRYLTRTNSLGFTRQDIIAIGPCTPMIEQKILESPLAESHVSRCPTIYPVYVFQHRSIYGDKDDIGIDSLALPVLLHKITPAMVDFWHLDLINGNMPNPESAEILVNEAACKLLGLQHPVGHEIYNSESDSEQAAYVISGVIADIYTAPPTQEPAAAMYTVHKKMSEPRDPYDYEYNFLSVKARSGHKHQLLDSIRAWIEIERNDYSTSHQDLSDMWALTSGDPVDVEDEFDKMIHSELLLTRLLGIIAACCIVVCLIGAYSTISRWLQERRKEIALRKIHGAKAKTITAMFMRGYAISLAIATCIATPVDIIFMMRWLDTYRKHIPCPYWLAIAVPAALMAMVAITIIHRVYKAAHEQPADSLKTE